MKIKQMEYQVVGCYEGKWEEVYASDSFDDAYARLREYRENEVGRFRIKSVRVGVQRNES